MLSAYRVLDLTDDRLTMTIGDEEVADWAREGMRISALPDGFHIRAEGEAIVLEVEDNGRGIPADHLEGLFDPAFHVDRGRLSTTHWGLFITRTIVADHGGHIELDSKEGQGTTVRILLPVIANRQSECGGCSSHLTRNADGLVQAAEVTVNEFASCPGAILSQHGRPALHH